MGPHNAAYGEVERGEHSLREAQQEERAESTAVADGIVFTQRQQVVYEDKEDKSKSQASAKACVS